MKVITQLVQHFWERGALTAEDAAYLVRSGFVRAADLPGFKLPPDDEPSAPMPLRTPTPVGVRALEAVQESLVRRGKRRRKSGPKTAVLEPREVCERVKAEFARRAGDLESLPLACPKPAPATWELAAAELRSMAPEKSRSLLASRLRQGVVGLARLWNAVDLEPFHCLLGEEEIRGRAARAYSALLVAHDAASLGTYGWILKYDEMQAVANLRSVRNRLLEALYHLASQDRAALTRCLARGSTGVATWSLVLLYNANRNGGRTASIRTEFGPVAPPIGIRSKQAWTAALEMDPVHVAQLLVDCYGKAAVDDAPNQEEAAVSLFCPKGWHLPPNDSSA